ncbi:hypothetical protein [Deinococcus soli (ex Cha et al. 2016)]|uniref:Uncharacterized protein n=2 Tax=Deinococcus soli (ex Cha et al. 2016) TaxID=1309411 RepID=A0ACC6KKW1_9DEIO|nr:hypothetical protein [Deinococcus soli (ex Cha et al. 2016)]MDR6218647.1 hypothetical protein [Deinococcus soli (ex Cha et al. 2016)]MDR6328444.1 hypothetical protein [Deinococcus soli (ex Cha et al. 2016)]MDR6753055.1 hypothetical protein [Deinococcus soli (ex Cha et al. 2016)]
MTALIDVHTSRLRHNTGTRAALTRTELTVTFGHPGFPDSALTRAPRSHA